MKEHHEMLVLCLRLGQLHTLFFGIIQHNKKRTRVEIDERVVSCYGPFVSGSLYLIAQPGG